MAATPSLWVFHFGRQAIDTLIKDIESHVEIGTEIVEVENIAATLKTTSSDFGVPLARLDKVYGDLIEKSITCKLALGVRETTDVVSAVFYTDEATDLTAFKFCWKFVLSITEMKRSMTNFPTASLFKLVFGFISDGNFDILFGPIDEMDHLISVLKNPRISVAKGPRISV